MNGRRGDYGLDEPRWLVLLTAMAGAWGALAVIAFGLMGAPALGWAAGILSLAFLLSAGSYLYTTRWGKFAVWRQIFTELALRRTDRLLDMGCGRGAVLLLAARLLPEGSVTGVDVWNTTEQSGNRLTVTERNAQREGVASRVALCTADIRSMPFPGDSFDLVVSSMVIHNIRDPRERLRAIDEAVRVLRPGGRLVVVDLGHVCGAYTKRLQELGMTGVARRRLGWRFWYGGPWAAAEQVMGQKPSV